MRFPGTDEVTYVPSSWAKMDGRRKSFELPLSLIVLPSWKHVLTWR